MIGKNREKRYTENVANAESGCIFFASMCTRETRCRIFVGIGVTFALRRTAFTDADRVRELSRSRVEPRLLFDTSLHPKKVRRRYFLQKGIKIWIPLRKKLCIQRGAQRQIIIRFSTSKMISPPSRSVTPPQGATQRYFSFTRGPTQCSPTAWRISSTDPSTISLPV